MNPQWDAVTLAERNELSQYLFDYHRTEYRERWNSVAIAANGFIQEEVEPRLYRNIWQDVQGGTAFAAAIEFDVKRSLCCAFIEKAFEDCDPPVQFFTHLLSLFEAGHYPCGWLLPWPDGTLVVF